MNTSKQNGWPTGWIVKSVSVEERHEPRIIEMPPIFTDKGEAIAYFNKMVEKLKSEMHLGHCIENWQTSGYAILTGDEGIGAEVSIEDAYLALMIYEGRVFRTTGEDGKVKYVFKRGGYVPRTKPVWQYRYALPKPL